MIRVELHGLKLVSDSLATKRVEKREELTQLMWTLDGWSLDKDWCVRVIISWVLCERER